MTKQKRYWLYSDEIYEPYFIMFGTIEEIIQELKRRLEHDPYLTDDDFSVYEQADVSILELLEKAKGE
jgi:hypothetical protein